MRYNRILLISPPSSSYLGAARPPQNLGYLAESLLANNIHYDVLDMRFGGSLKRLIRKIEWFQPDLIGISMVSLEYRKTYEMIRVIKDHYPHVGIVAGGPHVTVCRERVLEGCPSIDFGVVHEGEETLVELCRGEHFNRIGGLIHRKPEGIVFNGNRAPQTDLDAIPFPTYQGFELDRYIKEIPINSSRGCPLQCIFCPNRMITQKFRPRSPAHVADEIEYWHRRSYRVFNFDDDNFTLSRDRVLKLCDEIKKRGLTDAEFRCSNGLRADRVDRKLLKRMKDVGFHYIAFGVDGGNDRMLRANKKGESIEQIERAIRTACDLGYDVKLFCIFGMPFETWDDVMDSFRLVQKYPVRRVILNNPIPYPGTELYDIIQERDAFIKSPEIYLNSVTENENEPVFETPELNREQRKRLLKMARRIEKDVTRRAVQLIIGETGFLSRLAGSLFASSWGQRLFFQNMIFRRCMESLRHHRMMDSRVVYREG
ncbi:MAG TPA: radical SAM protein [bacterium]|nr:radical SAM protein [bacterium]